MTTESFFESYLASDICDVPAPPTKEMPEGTAIIRVVGWTPTKTAGKIPGTFNSWMNLTFKVEQYTELVKVNAAIPNENTVIEMRYFDSIYSINEIISFLSNVPGTNLRDKLAVTVSERFLVTIKHKEETYKGEVKIKPLFACPWEPA
jgi:hypothetical protein